MITKADRERAQDYVLLKLTQRQAVFHKITEGHLRTKQILKRNIHHAEDGTWFVTVDGHDLPLENMREKSIHEIIHGRYHPIRVVGREKSYEVDRLTDARKKAYAMATRGDFVRLFVEGRSYGEVEKISGVDGSKVFVHVYGEGGGYIAPLLKDGRIKSSESFRVR